MKNILKGLFWTSNKVITELQFVFCLSAEEARELDVTVRAYVTQFEKD